MFIAAPHRKPGLRQEAHVTVSGVARSYGHRTGLYARLSCLFEERATAPMDLLRDTRRRLGNNITETSY